MHDDVPVEDVRDRGRRSIENEPTDVRCAAPLTLPRRTCRSRLARIEFISDLHLGPDTPRTFDAWAALPRRARRADAVLHARRPVRGLGRRRHAPAEPFEASVRATCCADAPPAAGPGLHGRQPRLPASAPDCCRRRHDRPARPHRAARLRPAAAADARRRAVPGRHGLPGVPRARCAPRHWQAAFLAKPLAAAPGIARGRCADASSTQRSAADVAPTSTTSTACRALAARGRRAARWSTATRTGPASTTWRAGLRASC